MIRLVAALLLVFFGTVHTWAGGNDGVFARPFLLSGYGVSAHGGLNLAQHIGGANKETSVQGSNKCCSKLVAPVVSFPSNCMFANMIIASPGAFVCPRTARGAAMSGPKLFSLDGTTSIFRPPII